MKMTRKIEMKNDNKRIKNANKFVKNKAYVQNT